MTDDRWRDSYDQWKLASPYDDWDDEPEDEPEDEPADTIDDLMARCGS